MIWSLGIALLNTACVIWSLGSNDIDGATYANLFFAVTLAFIAGTEK